MLAGMSRHPEFEPILAWDARPETRDRVAQEYPSIRIAEGPEQLASSPVDLVYIATPPSTHLEYAALAARHGKAVLCEKPLAADLDESRRVVREVADRGIRNAVNFSMASYPAVATVERILREGSPGTPIRLEMRFHFQEWPRAWQAGAAGWLAKRAEGGFVREVVSHFVYLTHRILGRSKVVASKVRYPGGEGSETFVDANLEAGGLPIAVVGGVGGAAPDYNEWTLYATERSIRLQDWSRLRIADRGRWHDAMPEREAKPHLGDQLDSLADMLAGRPHPLPDFAAGLEVEEVIEGILRCPAA